LIRPAEDILDISMPTALADDESMPSIASETWRDYDGRAVETVTLDVDDALAFNFYTRGEVLYLVFVLDGDDGRVLGRSWQTCHEARSGKGIRPQPSWR
jgi:hypothetical protein